MKIIYHLGSWFRNYGDLAIRESICNHLMEISEDEYLVFRALDSKYTQWDEQLVDRINEDGNMLLIGGGGLLFTRSENKEGSGWQFNISLELLDRIKVPIVVYGIGDNRFQKDEEFPPQFKEHILKVIEKAQLFSVRDQRTKDYLVSLGANDYDIQVIMDPAYYIPTPIGVVILEWLDKKIVGVNLAGDRIEERHGSWESACQFYQDLAKQIPKDAYKVVLFPHISQDYKSLDYFKKLAKLQGLDVYTLGREEYFPETVSQLYEILALYGTCTEFYGERLHSLILAKRMGVDTVHQLGHHRKLERFFEELEREDKATTFDEFNREVLRCLK